MLVRHHHEGLVYVVEVPEGTRLYRSKLTEMSTLYVLWDGIEHPVFDEPGELIVQLAEAGWYGMRLIEVEGPRGAVETSHDRG